MPLEELIKLEGAMCKRKKRDYQEYKEPEVEVLIIEDEEMPKRRSKRSSATVF